jgi:hypothetical protein
MPTSIFHVSKYVENTGEGGSQPVGSARGPFSPPSDNHLEPCDGGDPAPEAIEGQRGDDVRGAV